MLGLLCTLTLALGQDMQEQPAMGLTWRNVHVAMPSRQIHLYDPLLVKIVLLNREDAPLEAPAEIAYWSAHTVRDRSGEYRYRYGADGGFWAPRRREMVVQSGELFTLQIRHLSFPPRGSERKQFWEDLVGTTFAFETHIKLPPETTRIAEREIVAQMTLNLTVTKRPQAEMEFLDALFGENDRRPPGDVTRSDPQLERPQCFHFGIFLRRDVDLTEQLLAYEEKLSPGTLLNGVYVTKMMRKIYDLPNDEERLEQVEQLVEWLDALADIVTNEPTRRVVPGDRVGPVRPSVEREYYCEQILSWMENYHPDEAAYHQLFYECFERLPKHYREHDDYHAFLVSTHPASKHVPGYQNYIERRKSDKNRP